MKTRNFNSRTYKHTRTRGPEKSQKRRAGGKLGGGGIIVAFSTELKTAWQGAVQTETHVIYSSSAWTSVTLSRKKVLHTLKLKAAQPGRAFSHIILSYWWGRLGTRVLPLRNDKFAWSACRSRGEQETSRALLRSRPRVITNVQSRSGRHSSVVDMASAIHWSVSTSSGELLCL